MTCYSFSNHDNALSAIMADGTWDFEFKVS